MKIYEQDGIKYISHKDAMTYYRCTSTTLRNWRTCEKIKCLELPLESGRLYALDPELKKYHLGGERYGK